MRVLCVAEKPSIARSITSILSGGPGQFTTRNSPNKFIKNFDFDYGQTRSFFTVTSVSGHLMSHDFPDTHRSWHSCDPFTLFDAPVISQVSNDARTIETNLKQEARGKDMLMIWTDCDREGENIGAEVARVCQRANPNIQVKRARFSAIIAQQIHRAAQHPVELDMAQADAVEARTILDLRIGAAFTRMQTLALQSRVKDLSMCSYGPCQFPTLGFVVSRYQQVKGFVPETFWYIFLSLTRLGEGEETVFNWRRGHLFDFEVAVALYERVLEDPRARVTKVIEKNTKKWKPLPLTTVELQKAGSRLLRLAPKKVLDVAEKLYQQGFVSYPRTETDQFDRQFDFMTLIQKQTADPVWGQFAASLQNGGFTTPRRGKNDDKAHPPIHPTAHAGNLAGDEKRVYEFIARRFLACCSKDAEGSQTTVEVLCGGEEFSASGLVVLARNYLEVYPYDKWTGKELPEFREGEEFMPTVCELRDGETSKPSLLTEADLVTLMDKNGIGTDATIAQHIQTIVDREYVIERMEGNTKYLVPSTLGIGLIEGYNQIGFERSLSKPQLRRETERSMVQVCERAKTKNDMLQESIEQYKDMYLRAKGEFAKVVTSVRRYIEGGTNAGNNGSGGGGGGGGGPGPNTGPDSGAGRGRGARARGTAPSTRARGRGRGAARAPPPRGPSPPSDLDDFNDPPPPPAPAPRSRTRAAPSAPPPSSSRTLVALDTAPLSAGPPLSAHSRPLDSASGPTVEVSCMCGVPAAERTVTKESPNKGRRFWTCEDKKCEFFEWVDGPSAAGGGLTNGGDGSSAGRGAMVPAKRSYTEQYTESSGASILDANGQPRLCKCSMTAIQRKVTKEGPNTGRSFWTCPNPEGSRCGYFEWDDAGPEDGLPSGGMMAGAGGGQSGECYKCHQEGHWASKCPNGDATDMQRTRSLGIKGATNATGACFTCGQEGHFSNACPNSGPAIKRYASGGGSKPDDVCFKCNRAGHYSNACPNGASVARGNSTSSRGTKRGRGRGGSTRGKTASKRGAKKSKFGAADDSF